jgi:hypothetical protein
VAHGHVDEVRRLCFDPLTKAQQRQVAAAQRILIAMDAPCPTDWPPIAHDRNRCLPPAGQAGGVDHPQARVRRSKRSWPACRSGGSVFDA